MVFVVVVDRREDEQAYRNAAERLIQRLKACRHARVPVATSEGNSDRR